MQQTTSNKSSKEQYYSLLFDYTFCIMVERNDESKNSKKPSTTLLQRWQRWARSRPMGEHISSTRILLNIQGVP